MKIYSLILCSLIQLTAFSQKSVAQNEEKHTLDQRAQQILSKLNIADAGKRAAIESILDSHFDSLNKIFSSRKAAIVLALEQSSVNKELAEARSEKAWDAANGKFNKLHATFLGKLSSLLTATQVETVKDVMTENGLQAEYKRFLALLPNLTEQQKAQVKTYLNEARENAMDAETADMRKQWFIKYRGRANNFLAAAGYDLQKATADLERKKEAQTKAQSNK
ncbi:DUF3826 domain-containing protein [Flavisolibacter sp. BT320]|nr:DUF3826 domain-containing protein [Flavisolibacter longurius]